MLYEPQMTEFYLLYFDFILKNSAQNDSKGTAIKNIPPFDILKEYLIPIPPLAEQERIVAAIESAFAVIDEIERNKTDLQAVVSTAKSKILSLAIRGKLVPQDPSDEPASILLERIRAERETLVKTGKIKRGKGEITAPVCFDNPYYQNINGVEEFLPQIPMSWVWVLLKDVGLYSSGKTPMPSELKAVGQYPYFKVADMNTVGNELFLRYTESYLTDDYRGTLFPANSIVFPKNGGAVLTNKKRVLFQKSLVDLNTGIYSPTAQIDFWYIFYFFTSIDFRNLFKGAVLPTLDRSVVELMAFPLPPLAEQQRIVVAIEAAFKQLDCITATLA